jgi:hypothetical protein
MLKSCPVNGAVPAIYAILSPAAVLNTDFIQALFTTQLVFTSDRLVGTAY